MRPSRRAILACAFLSVCSLVAVLIAGPWQPSTRDGSAAPEARTAPGVVAEGGVVPARGPRPSATPPATVSPAAPAVPAAPPADSPSASPTASPSPRPSPTAVPVEGSLLRDNQVIVYYGTPLASGLGVLGTMPPEEAARAVKARAETFDLLNGEALGAVPALDIIYSLAQAEPTSNGMYVRHLPDEHVERYLRVAEEQDLQIILDLQIGRSAIIDEVRRIEKFLRHPRVHVAIDPEYAVGPDGVPIATPGRISGDEINGVQAYLDDLVEAHGLPPKMLVVHQYMDATIVEPQKVEVADDVDYVLNMDAFGDVKEKKKKYRHFASKPPHTKLDAFNVFLAHDHAVLSEQEILELSPLPHVVFYQ